ncbi:MAG: hypothetical protein AAFY57_02325 [Cyanobacteria bacterium J06642_2]
MTNNSSPEPGDFKKIYQAIVGLIEWLALELRNGGWVRRLTLLGVALWLAPAAIAFSNVELPIDREALESVCPIAGVVCFGLAFAIAILRKPERSQVTFISPAEGSAIKGLRAFEAEDAEVFARLQRGPILKELVQTLSGSEFKFGILSGTSGAGKTSLLRAGVVPELRKFKDILPVYVKLTEVEPLEAIRRAIAEELDIEIEELSDRGLVGLLNRVKAKVGSQEIVLLLDQFEQFFVHFNRKEIRLPFVEMLAGWYRNRAQLPVRILISIRGDFGDRLVELQRVMGYSLGPQQVFGLQTFEPVEAAAVLKEIAAIEGIDCNDKFLREVAEDELGDRDGLVSPVDVQVFAWMVSGQRVMEERAFNRQAFGKLGGIEGLLTRFLERALEPRKLEGRFQGTLQVMLGLTDLDRNTRAGVLTADEVVKTLGGRLLRQEVAEALGWLERADVRLVTAVRGQAEWGYELAHERLIPALMRVAGRELDRASRANQLLDQRVNEWLANGKARRYLLGLGELSEIEQQRPYLVWGTKKRQKEELLRGSRRRLQWGAWVAAAIALLWVMGFAWLGSPGGQIWQSSRALFRWSLGRNEASFAAIQAFTANGDWKRSFKLATDIQDSKDQAGALMVIAEATASLEDGKRAAVVLAQALEIATDIQNTRDQAILLYKIAEATASLEDSERAAAVLAQALEVAADIQNTEDQAIVLRGIAEATASLEDSKRAAAVLARALEVATDIQNTRDQAIVLRGIAEAYASLEDGKRAAAVLAQALEVATDIQDSENQAGALSRIAEAYASLEDGKHAAAVLAQALEVATDIQDSENQAGTLSEIAEATASLEDGKHAAEVLAQALEIATDIQDSENQAGALSEIAAASVSLEDSKRAAAVLAQALEIATDIQDSENQASALRGITAATASLEDSVRATTVLTQALEVATNFQNSGGQADVLSWIAEVYISLEDGKRAAAVLAQALEVATDIQNSENQAGALSRIAEATASLEDSERAAAILARALEVATNLQYSGDQTVVLSRIAEATASLEDSERAAAILARALEVATDIQESRPQAFFVGRIPAPSGSLEASKRAADQAMVLSWVAKAYANLGDSVRAAEILAQALEIATDIQDSENQAIALSEIAAASVSLEDSVRAAVVLAQTLEIATDIQNSGNQAGALRGITAATASLEDSVRATAVLTQALEVATNIQYSSDQADVLSWIAEVYISLEDSVRAVEVLARALEVATNIQNSNAQAGVLSRIAEAYANLKHWRVARLAATQTTLSRDERAQILARILVIWSHRNDPPEVPSAS